MQKGTNNSIKSIFGNILSSEKSDSLVNATFDEQLRCYKIWRQRIEYVDRYNSLSLKQRSQQDVVSCMRR